MSVEHKNTFLTFGEARKLAKERGRLPKPTQQESQKVDYIYAVVQALYEYGPMHVREIQRRAHVIFWLPASGKLEGHQKHISIQSIERTLHLLLDKKLIQYVWEGRKKIYSIVSDKKAKLYALHLSLWKLRNDIAKITTPESEYLTDVLLRHADSAEMDDIKDITLHARAETRLKHYRKLLPNEPAKISGMFWWPAAYIIDDYLAGSLCNTCLKERGEISYLIYEALGMKVCKACGTEETSAAMEHEKFKDSMGRRLSAGTPLHKDLRRLKRMKRRQKEAKQETERMITELLDQHKTYKQIINELGVSPGTISNVRKRAGKIG